MEVKSAIQLVNSLVYKEGWRITAESHTHRFEASIVVLFEYPCKQSERELIENGAAGDITGRARFPILVGDCEDDCAVYRRVVEAIALIELHEIREFLRVLPTYWAPFHPHRLEGMKRWGNVYGDLTFGIA